MSATTSTLQLTSCHSVECTSPSRFLWTWSYPSLSSQNRLAHMKKLRSLLREFKNFRFQFFHHGDQWVYIHRINLQNRPGSEFTAILVCALDFNPERYEKLCGILGEKYAASDGQPASILRPFLSILTTGKCMILENDSFYFNEYEGQDVFRHPKLSGTIEAFGVEVIFIYTSLLLKRRIFVYHHDVTGLYDFILSLPAFVKHREDIWNSLYPVMENSETELASFQDSKFHILGFTDDHVSNRTELFDIYINVPAAEVMVAPHARESLSMTKTHKDIALFMVQLSEKKTEFTERHIIQEIGRKTKELIENLRTMVRFVGGRETLSLAELKTEELSPTLESFLIELAQAENISVIP